jgi:hypothetical protein
MGECHEVRTCRRREINEIVLQDPEKPSAIKRENLALQNMICSLYSIFVGHFCPPESRSNRPKSMRIYAIYATYAGGGGTHAVTSLFRRWQLENEEIKAFC